MSMMIPFTYDFPNECIIIVPHTTMSLYSIQLIRSDPKNKNHRRFKEPKIFYCSSKNHHFLLRRNLHV